MNILITGGSGGLGKATVELLAKDKNHNIWFSYYPCTNDEIVAQVLTQECVNVVALPLDFSNEANVDSFCIILKEIDLDVLVNCTYVGAPQTTHFHKISSDEFLTGFKNNLLPTIKITQTAISIFRKKRFGKIINILTEALIGLPPMGYSIYAANKAYLQELSKVWNKEYSSFNITSNCILPAFMQTNFAQIDERILEQMINEHPLKKILRPEEVASVVKFLIDASQQVNGVNIPVNAAKTIL